MGWQSELSLGETHSFVCKSSSNHPPPKSKFARIFIGVLIHGEVLVASYVMPRPLPPFALSSATLPPHPFPSLPSSAIAIGILCRRAQGAAGAGCRAPCDEGCAEDDASGTAGEYTGEAAAVHRASKGPAPGREDAGTEQWVGTDGRTGGVREECRIALLPLPPRTAATQAVGRSYAVRRRFLACEAPSFGVRRGRIYPEALSPRHT